MSDDDERTTVTLRLTVLVDDGEAIDEEHVAVLTELAAEDDLFLTRTNERLRRCTRPATAYLGSPAPC